jgi:hypothetical protein
MAWYELDRRRRVVVNDGSMQGRIVLSVSVPMFVLLLLVLGAQLVFDHLVRTGTLDVDGRILGLPERSLSAVLFFVFATLYHVTSTLKFSHRIAGASHNMERVLRAFRAGDKAARIRLREEDLPQSLAAEINATLDWVSGEAGQHEGERASAPDRAPDEAPATRPGE